MAPQNIRSKKELAVALSHLETFKNPDPRLEQYATPSEIAADLLWRANMSGHIEEKKVLDLGAGTGILGIGALLLGATEALFVEMASQAVELLKKNLKALKGTYEGKATILEKDLFMTDVAGDTIVMNPPFGTRDTHADERFLAYALTHADVTYSFHKTTTLMFLRERIIALDGKILEEQRCWFPLRQTMSHHTKPVKKIDVTLLVITRE